ncbi:MAG: hypothetical protein JOZ97_03250 [Candidatus Eremiobacteraeota bacterium]|nr:hypothetical protein [Candidatus Eremiobacteraeota bacterium]
MTTRLFLLTAGLLAAIALPGNAAKGDTAATPASGQYGYVTKVPASTTTDATSPQIFEIDMNAQQLNAPGPLAIRVLTSPNVAAVYAHVAGQTFGIPLVQSGHFELAAQLPTLPASARGRNYTFDFEAVTSDQKRATADVAVFLAP